MEKENVYPEIPYVETYTSINFGFPSTDLVDLMDYDVYVDNVVRVLGRTGLNGRVLRVPITKRKKIGTSLTLELEDNEECGSYEQIDCIKRFVTDVETAISKNPDAVGITNCECDETGSFIDFSLFEPPTPAEVAKYLDKMYDSYKKLVESHNRDIKNKDRRKQNVTRQNKLREKKIAIEYIKKYGIPKEAQK